MKKKRIIIWGAWYGSRNVGDRALLLAIMDSLQQVFDQVSFVVLSAQPDEVFRYARRDSASEFKVLRTKKDMFQVISEIAKADLFVFGGGVPFFDSVRQLIAMFGLVFFARLFRTPYYLWTVSSLPIQKKLAMWVFRFVLAGASGITYRDQHTQELFRACGVDDHRMLQVADSAFSLKHGTRDDAHAILENAGYSSQDSRPLVALTPRLLRAKDGEAETHYSPQSDDQNKHEVNVFAAVLDWLWEHGYQPIFIPMNSVAPDDDRKASKQAIQRARYGDKALLVNVEVPPRLASLLYEACIAGFVSRVHGSILAFSANRPVVMYAFDMKHKGIMEVMGLGEFVFEPEYHSPGEAVLMMKKLIDSIPALEEDMIKHYQLLYADSFTPQKAVLELLS